MIVLSTNHQVIPVWTPLPKQPVFIPKSMISMGFWEFLGILRSFLEDTPDTSAPLGLPHTPRCKGRRRRRVGFRARPSLRRCFRCGRAFGGAGHGEQHYPSNKLYTKKWYNYVYIYIFNYYFMFVIVSFGCGQCWLTDWWFMINFSVMRRGSKNDPNSSSPNNAWNLDLYRKQFNHHANGYLKRPECTLPCDIK